jgi:hypothetical protein
VRPAKDSSAAFDAPAYFVPERELDKYSEAELASAGPGAGLCRHEAGEFVFKKHSRSRESSASYYTPECLAQCLVKYSLKTMGQFARADDILKLKVMEPAMGAGAFLIEATSQLARMYLDMKQKELGRPVPEALYEEELAKAKTYIAQHIAYGIDLNPIAVHIAEALLWVSCVCREPEYTHTRVNND